MCALISEPYLDILSITLTLKAFCARRQRLALQARGSRAARRGHRSSASKMVRREAALRWACGGVVMTSNKNKRSAAKMSRIGGVCKCRRRVLASCEIIAASPGAWRRYIRHIARRDEALIGMTLLRGKARPKYIRAEVTGWRLMAHGAVLAAAIMSAWRASRRAMACLGCHAERTIEKYLCGRGGRAALAALIERQKPSFPYNAHYRPTTCFSYICSQRGGISSWRHIRRCRAERRRGRVGVRDEIFCDI